MSNISETISAGLSKQFNIEGDFIRLMNTTGAVEIVYYRNGAECARTGIIQAGYAETFKGGDFTSVIITDKSGASNAIEFVYRMGGDVRYDRSAGNVTVTNTNGNYASAAVTVTTASQALVSANVSRRYLLIQNRDTVGNLFVNFGAAATAGNGGNGLKIAPGGSFVAEVFAPKDAIHIIGDIASNANVLVIQG